MEDIKDKISDLASHVEDLAQTYYRLSLIKVTERAANVAAASIATIAIVIGGMFVLLLAAIALSLWLGDLVSNRAVGFLMGAGIFLIITITIILLRKKIVMPYFKNRIIRRFYE